MQDFERQFKTLLYGGISVQRCVRGVKERRTLWLLNPDDRGSLQIGFVSKLSSEEAMGRQRMVEPPSTHGWGNMNDEEVTLDSALVEKVRNNGNGI